MFWEAPADTHLGPVLNFAFLTPARFGKFLCGEACWDEGLQRSH